MVARFAGASLGLLAFAVTIVAGLFTGNPPTAILTRALFALFLFCLIGLALGKTAQLIVDEYERARRAEIQRRFASESAGRASAAPGSPPAAA